MATWMWIKGVPGPPGNDGWLELFKFGSVGTSKAIDARIPRDGSLPYILQLCVSGQEVAEIIVFFEPQTEIHFYECTINSANSGVGGSTDLNLSFSYNRLERIYSGDP
jgi:hypothetical protein